MEDQFRALGLRDPVGDVAIQLLDNFVELGDIAGLESDVRCGEIGADGLAELIGGPQTFACENGEDFGWIVAHSFLIHVLLDGPRGVANTIERCAKVAKKTLVNVAREQEFLQNLELPGGILHGAPYGNLGRCPGSLLNGRREFLLFHALRSTHKQLHAATERVGAFRLHFGVPARFSD